MVAKCDKRVITVILLLMLASLLTLAGAAEWKESLDEPFFPPSVFKQCKWFFLGWVAFFGAASFDYRKLREWTWIFYALALLSLFGVFFVDPIQRVHRWYRLPFIGMHFQPSEYAKLAVIFALSWWLEKRKDCSYRLSTSLVAGLLAGIPFLLIFKQPDLGTSLILFPVTLVLLYIGHANKWIFRSFAILGFILFFLTSLVFLGVVSHESARPYATKILKPYQYERLDPNTHHQTAAAMAISLGGWQGTGWQKGVWTRGGWLPAATTDSIFPAFAEQFGFLGTIVLLALFWALVRLSFEVVVMAKDVFGRLLAAGIASLLGVHALINLAMMSGLLPITGVPLLLMSYGGSSLLFSMASLGILESIRQRRFTF